MTDESDEIPPEAPDAPGAPDAPAPDGAEAAEEEVLSLDESSDDLQKVMAEAEQAVDAVGERHRIVAPERPSAEELLRQLELTHNRLAAAQEEIARMRDLLTRKAADFENLKKRTEKEKTEYFKFALAEVFRECLPVLDNFERALPHLTQELGRAVELKAGIEMVARQLAETLRRYGLAEVPAQGLPFDPNIHEAVAQEDVEGVAPGTVFEVLQKGYLLNDRLLRPALVKVATGPGQGT